MLGRSRRDSEGPRVTEEERLKEEKIERGMSYRGTENRRAIGMEGLAGRDTERGYREEAKPIVGREGDSRATLCPSSPCTLPLCLLLALLVCWALAWVVL